MLHFQAEEGAEFIAPTPTKGILKTPGSVKRSKNVLFAAPLRQSPRNILPNKENNLDANNPMAPLK